MIGPCFEICTKHTQNIKTFKFKNTLCGQNVGFFNVSLVVHKVTTELINIYFRSVGWCLNEMGWECGPYG